MEARERNLVSLLVSFSFFPCFHSCALTETVRRSGRLESAADVGVRKARERARYIPVLAGPDRPQSGRAVPSERALAVQLLTLKLSPAKGYAKDTQHHDTGLWKKKKTINSSLLTLHRPEITDAP